LLKVKKLKKKDNGSIASRGGIGARRREVSWEKRRALAKGNYSLPCNLIQKAGAG